MSDDVDDDATITLSQFKTLISNELDKRARIPSHVHDSHHQWVKEKMHAEDRTDRAVSEVKAKVIGWGIIATLGGIGKFVYDHLSTFWQVK